MVVDLPWPRPVKDRAKAEAEVLVVLPHLRRPTMQGVMPVQLWAWEKAATWSIGALTLAIAYLLEFLVPTSYAHGRASEAGDLMAAHILGASAVARLRAAAKQKHPPRWACRVARLLPCGVFPSLLVAGSPAELTMIAAFNGMVSEKGAVYTLCGHSAYYVGKASVWRAGGVRGLPARLGEHLRLLCRGKAPGGNKPRYTMLRRSLGSVCFLLVSLADTVSRALAIEALLIKMEVPEANLADQAFDQKQRGVLPRLSPTPRKRRRRPFPAYRKRGNPFQSVWTLQFAKRT